MRRIEDLPQKEIASRLQIAEATVEKHLVLGIRALAEAFYGDARRPDESATEDSSSAGNAHGE
jgi:RNA polymerase sigma-70 factor (ECF subfamily)